MTRPIDLREPMDMPDPSFPIKVHLISCTEPGRTMFPHHWHRHIEFLYLTSGKLYVECNYLPIEAAAGDLIVVNSNDIHYGVCASDDLSYYALIADLSLLQSASGDSTETKYITPLLQNRIVIGNHIPYDSDIIAAIKDLIGELGVKEAGYELSVKASLFRILTLLVRRYYDGREASGDDRTRQRDLERFTPVFHYIEQHYRDEISVQKLADLVGLSRFHFSRLFKSLTNRTLVEYVNLIRVDQSEYLLRHTPMSVSEVALASGFNDIYYFSRLFKKIKKVPPSELRRTGNRI